MGLIVFNHQFASENVNDRNTRIRSMKKFQWLLFVFASVFFFSSKYASAQCPAGYTQSQINWDNLDYLVTTGNYSGFVNTTIAGNQYFMMGTTRAGITASPATITLSGENEAHTGELSGYTGQDVQYTPALIYDSIFISFDQPVANAGFALYDIDNLGSFRILAYDNTGASLNVSITIQASTILTLGGVPTAPTVGTTSSTNLANSSNRGSAIVTVAGPVSVIKIVVLNVGSDPVFWLSDINGCVTGSFPNNWRNISQPFTGMPSYILTAVDNTIMMLNPANGQAKTLFTDPGWTSVDGMAYDPVHRELYYTYSSMPSPLANKTIWKYSLDSETISPLIIDVTSILGIPTYDKGVESGSASYYNGFYYLGVESSNAALTSGRENTVWRIEFDEAQIPIRATQVYATRSDSAIGGTATLIHDWSDIGVSNNAMLYDFDGASADPQYYHFNLMTGQRTQYTPGAGAIRLPQQLAIDWKEKVYNQGNTIFPGTSEGFIVPYNYNGTVNSAENYSIVQDGVALTGNWNDCSEAFRPLCDFGDAPASYDPDPLSPAVHERDPALRIGASFDREWNKTTSVFANADGADEDGLAYTPIFAPIAGNYLAQVTIYNNTGEEATLMAWLDFNDNGVFDAMEACQALAPIPSSDQMQTSYLYWPYAPTSIPNGGYTYLRIRLTRTIWGMNSSNATGYFEDGETEDYRILVDDYPLSVNLLSFTANAGNDNKVNLHWITSGESNISGYEVQRSSDNKNWNVLSTVNAIGNGTASPHDYSFDDHQPIMGESFYRLRLVSNGGEARFSETRRVNINKWISDLVLSPNPATDKVTLSLYCPMEADAVISIAALSGRNKFSQNYRLNKGINHIDLPFIQRLNSGMYIVMIRVQDKMFSQKLIIQNK